MNNHFILFTQEHGILLIRLLIAQIIGDFVFQTKKMVQNKKMFSLPMGIHLLIVFGVSVVLSGWLWQMSLIITITHWLIDSLKIEVSRQKHKSTLLFFIGDQLLHFAVIIILWAWHFKIFNVLGKAFVLPFNEYKIGLILLGYALVLFPVGYFIKFATEKILAPNNMQEGDNGQENEQAIPSGGMRIGQYERIIILTFVLLNQYPAIGFLITGKSIMRFAQHEENIRTEYVLVGTMMSYAFAILIGVLINWLLIF